MTNSIICDTISTKGRRTNETCIRKQPRKYLEAADANTRKKLDKALEGLKELRGDIVRLNGKEQNLYRLKIEHFRIIFLYNGDEIIIVDTIDTRTNIKYRRFK